MELKDQLSLITRQEQELVFDAFTADDAWSIGSSLRERARAEEDPVVIDISLFDRALFYAALPGTTPDNLDWVRRKSNVVRRFYRSSLAIGLEMKSKNATLAERYGLPSADYADHGGSVPLRVRDLGCIGCVTISGLPQEMDHQIVVRALAGHLKLPPDAAAYDAILPC